MDRNFPRMQETETLTARFYRFFRDVYDLAVVQGLAIFLDEELGLRPRPEVVVGLPYERLPRPAEQVFARAIEPHEPQRLALLDKQHQGHVFDDGGQGCVGILEFLLDAFALFNVGARAEPFANLSVRTEPRLSSDQPPLIHAISAPQAAFERIGLTMFDRVLPGIPRALPIVGVERCDPACSAALFQGETRVVHPLLIEVDVLPISARGPDDLRHGLGQLPEFAFACLQRLLCALALSDVQDCAHHSDRVALWIPIDATLGRDPVNGLVRPTYSTFHVEVVGHERSFESSFCNVSIFGDNMSHEDRCSPYRNGHRISEDLVMPE